MKKKKLNTKIYKTDKISDTDENSDTVENKISYIVLKLLMLLLTNK